MTQPDEPPGEGRSRGRSIAAVILGLGLSALFAWLTVRQVDVAELAVGLRDVQPTWLALSMLTLSGGFMCLTARAAVLMRPLYPFGPWRLFASVMLGFVGNNLLPLRAGELARVGYLSRHGRLEPGSVLAAVAIERLFDVAALFAVLAVAASTVLVDLTPTRSMLGMAAVAAGGLGAALVISRYPAAFSGLMSKLSAPLGATLGGAITRLADQVGTGLAGVSSVGGLVGAVVATAGYWSCSLSSIWLWTQAMGLDLPWHAPFVIASFIGLGMLVPSAPSAAGTYHWFAASAVQLYGVAEASAVSWALVAHTMNIVPFTLIGIVLVGADLMAWARSSSKR